MKKIKSILAFSMLLAGVAAVGAVASNNDVKKVEAAESFSMVKDVNDLAYGDTIIIAAHAYDYALGTNQKTNNREGVAVTKNADGSIAYASNIQKITLTDTSGSAAGTFGFQAGSGYLYAASSGSNYLKTQTTNNANGAWAISIATNGVATIKASGSNTRNVMQYNPNNGSPLFACYASASQKAVAIYKVMADEGATEYTYSFDANGGAFADASLWGETSVAVGQEVEVTLPTASDMASTAYKYTNLVGWKAGTTVYEPGEVVTVSSAATFTAVYEAPALITIAQALEICEITGDQNTTCEFTVQGVVSELDASGVATYGNFSCTLTDETGSILAYRVKCDKTGLDLLDGDTIKVKGILINYKGNTPEFTSGGTYEFVSRPVVEPTLEEKLAEFTTNASVGFSFTKSGEDYSFSNVRLSFRGTISAELYEEVVAAGVTGVGIECSIEGEEAYTIDCSANIGTDAEGNKYVFGSLLVPEGKENIEVTAKAFVTVDGARLYLASTSHSLVSAVSAYLGGAVELTEEQLAAVTALAASLGINA